MPKTAAQPQHPAPALSLIRGQTHLAFLALVTCLGACTRPETPHSPDASGVPPSPSAAVTRLELTRDAAEPSGAAPDAATVEPRAEQARNEEADTSNIEIRLVMRKPLRITGKRLSGELTVTLTNRGSAPAKLTHADVHGFRFVEAKTGASYAVTHSCDCFFLLGLQPYPEAHRFMLEPGSSKELVFDEWDCAGGPFTAPPPGRYQVSWRLKAPVIFQGLSFANIPERCQTALQRHVNTEISAVSNSIDLEIAQSLPKKRPPPVRP